MNIKDVVTASQEYSALTLEYNLKWNALFS